MFPALAIGVAAFAIVGGDLLQGLGLATSPGQLFLPGSPAGLLLAGRIYQPGPIPRQQIRVHTGLAIEFLEQRPYGGGDRHVVHRRALIVSAPRNDGGMELIAIDQSTGED